MTTPPLDMTKLDPFEKQCSQENQASAKQIRDRVYSADFNELADLQEILRNLSEEALAQMVEIDE